MVFLMDHSTVVGCIVVATVEVFFSIDFPVLDTMVFSDTSFLNLSIRASFGIGYFALGIGPFEDIMSFTLLERIEVFFGIAVELVIDIKVFFGTLDLLVIRLTIDFDTQVFFGIIVELDYSDFTIFIHEFVHLHLGLAKQQQMALLITQLISLCFTCTGLSYLGLWLKSIQTNHSFALVISPVLPFKCSRRSSIWHERIMSLLY